MIPRRASPALARILPFAVYIGFLGLESLTHPGFWLYGTQVAVVLTLLAWFWPNYAELHQPGAVSLRHWTLGLAVGIVVFIGWINLDFPWAQIGAGRGLAAEAAGDVFRFGLRMVGVAVVVPVMEELFWRSFIMRWLQNPDFLSVAPADVRWRWVLVSALLFASEHHLWLAGLMAGLIYGWFYRKNRHLWPVIWAHAVTNALLEVWVARTGNWHFL